MHQILGTVAVVSRINVAPGVLFGGKFAGTLQSVALWPCVWLRIAEVRVSCG